MTQLFNRLHSSRRVHLGAFAAPLPATIRSMDECSLHGGRKFTRPHEPTQGEYRTPSPHPNPLPMRAEGTSHERAPGGSRWSGRAIVRSEGTSHERTPENQTHRNHTLSPHGERVRVRGERSVFAVPSFMGSVEGGSLTAEAAEDSKRFNSSTIQRFNDSTFPLTFHPLRFTFY
jgi:hypothetical protein